MSGTDAPLPPPRRRIVPLLSGGLVRAGLATLSALGAGAAVLASGTARDMAATLVVIGFSPDRAQLLTALVIVAISVAVGTFVFGGRWSAILGGAGAFVLAYHHTFLAETRAALAARGAEGTFDPAGWALTTVSLATTVIVASWATATLAAIARRHVQGAISDLRGLRSRRPWRLGLVRPGAVAAIAVLLATTMPVLADMINFEPDVHMRTGSALTPGLAGSAPGIVLPPGTPSIPPSTLMNGGILAPPPGLGTRAPGAALSSARPWLAWRPIGSGTVETITLAAPWGPPGTNQRLTVYLPPGYAGSTLSYPVLYTVPWTIMAWQKGVNVVSMLDTLIDTGQMAPTIVVFVPEWGGPYPDSECADSIDHREWFARWMASTVVTAIDAQYRVIAEPAARAVMGFSQGGFCSSMLVLRDPGVFGTALSFSGYFQAGIHSGQTPNAWRPFGGNAAYEATFSPLVLAREVPARLRSALLIELCASPTEPFYGPEYTAFARVLAGAGIPVALLPNPLGHAWAAVREELPTMLTTWAARMAALSVFTA